MTYTIWDSELAFAIEDYGFNGRIMAVEVGFLFATIAYASEDVTPSAWLPLIHKNYMEKYGNQIDDLCFNLVNAKIGFVVPAYMDIESIEGLRDY